MTTQLPPRPRFGASTISDALDRLGIHGQALGLRPIGPNRELWGPAFTIRMAPAASPAGSVGDYIDDVGTGTVVVIDNDGRLDATVWGDILTVVAARKGLAGTVIDGVCRDSAILDDVDYAIFARGAHMRTGKDRVQLESVGDTVQVGGVRVGPGDYLFGDADGVVVIPRDRLDEVLLIAADIERAEDAIRNAVETGQSLVDARRRYGYHGLQTRSDGRAS